MRHPWELYPLHAEALVWVYPVRVGDNEDLRVMVGELLYSIARAGYSDDAMIRLHQDSERAALRGLLAYMSGYTER